MSASVQWDLLENWARSLNKSDYSPRYTFNDNGVIGSSIVYNSILGKNAYQTGAYSAAGAPGSVNMVLGWNASNPTKPTIGCRFYIPPGMSGAAEFGVKNSSGTICAYAAVDAVSGVVYIYDSTGLKYTSPNTVCLQGVPYYIEVSAIPSSTNGTIAVKINQGNAFSETIVGANTDPTSVGSYQTAFLQGANNSDSASTSFFTDIGVLDYAVSGNPQFYGDNNVQYLTATANGATINFTPNGLSANWQNVANIPPNTSDFNSSTTTGATDEFVVGNLSVLTESVGGIYVVSNAENISGGLHTYSQQWSGSGGSTYGSGSAITLTNGYLTYGSSPTTDPNTGAAWTLSGVNGMKIGYTLVS